jgi:hypothetical protein
MVRLVLPTLVGDAIEQIDAGRKSTDDGAD